MGGREGLLTKEALPSLLTDVSPTTPTAQSHGCCYLRDRHRWEENLVSSYQGLFQTWLILSFHHLDINILMLETGHCCPERVSNKENIDFLCTGKSSSDAAAAMRVLLVLCREVKWSV